MTGARDILLDGNYFDLFYSDGKIYTSGRVYENETSILLYHNTQNTIQIKEFDIPNKCSWNHAIKDMKSSCFHNQQQGYSGRGRDSFKIFDIDTKQLNLAC